MKPRVLLDVDGVLADFVTAYLSIVRHVTGKEHVPADVVRWDINESLGLSPDESRAVKRAVGEAQSMARLLGVYPGAQDGVRALQEIADVYIVTSPWNSNPTWTHDREHWLKKHFDIPHSRVIHTSAKHLVRGDVFVDDKVSALAAWKLEHEGAAVKWRTLHNASEAWNGDTTNHWSELSSIVARVALGAESERTP